MISPLEVLGLVGLLLMMVGWGCAKAGWTTERIAGGMFYVGTCSIVLAIALHMMLLR